MAEREHDHDPDLFRQFEEALFHPAVRRSAERIGALVAADFYEIGRNGEICGRDDLIAALAAEPDGDLPVATCSDFALTSLAADIVLVTFRSRGTAPDGSDRSAMRSSLWARRNGDWVLVFHQCTPL